MNTRTIDLTGIASKSALHQVFKTQLDFPDWYDPSWDALWDCLIAVKRKEMPEQLALVNWEEFAQTCPRDMQILRAIIQDYNQEMAPKSIALV